MLGRIGSSTRATQHKQFFSFSFEKRKERKTNAAALDIAERLPPLCELSAPLCDVIYALNPNHMQEKAGCAKIQ